MHVLGLSTFPVEAAATRFRLAQFIVPLKERGIDLSLSPFLSSGQFRELYEARGIIRKASGLLRSLAGRLLALFGIGKYDLILVQREAMFFGPAVFEWLYSHVGRLPVVLDLDDATYVRYVSPSYGRLGSFFKFFGKTDKLIKRSSIVICGNRYIAEYVESRGGKAVVIPTIVDNKIFCPTVEHNAKPVIGWIGTHSTFPFLESIFPVLERLAVRHNFKLRIVGAGRSQIAVPGVEVEYLEWNLDREVADFQSLDIGLYPIAVSSSANEQWILGKSGFKAIQYMAVGIPFVMSPIGICAEIGEPGKTHFNAETEEDWYNSLDILLSDLDRCRKIGSAGREYSDSNFDLDQYASVLADTLSSIVKNEDPPHR